MANCIFDNAIFDPRIFDVCPNAGQTKTTGAGSELPLYRPKTQEEKYREWKHQQNVKKRLRKKLKKEQKLEVRTIDAQPAELPQERLAQKPTPIVETNFAQELIAQNASTLLNESAMLEQQRNQQINSAAKETLELLQQAAAKEAMLKDEDDFFFMMTMH